jgi:hypothetical protein
LTTFDTSSISSLNVFRLYDQESIHLLLSVVLERHLPTEEEGVEYALLAMVRK